MSEYSFMQLPFGVQITIVICATVLLICFMIFIDRNV